MSPAINEKKWRASYYLTRRCDVDCWYCDVPHVDADRKTELDAAGVDRVINNLHRMGVDLIVFTGGEPFLRQDLLLRAISSAQSAGIYAVLLTNGRLICKSPQVRAVLAGLVAQCEPFGLSVSYDKPMPPDGEEPGAWADGSDVKSHHALKALDIARDMGLTDLTATVVLDDQKPTQALHAARDVAERGYDVLVNLVQRAAPGAANTTFRALPMAPDQMLASVAAALKMDKSLRVKNTGEFFDGIIDGTYRTWACSEPGLVVVQPDGRTDLCNNIRGELLPQMNLSHQHGDDLLARYREAWHADLKSSCPGCYLSCHVDFQYRHAAERS